MSKELCWELQQDLVVTEESPASLKTEEAAPTLLHNLPCKEQQEEKKEQGKKRKKKKKKNKKKKGNNKLPTQDAPDAVPSRAVAKGSNSNVADKLLQNNTGEQMVLIGRQTTADVETTPLTSARPLIRARRRLKNVQKQHHPQAAESKDTAGQHLSYSQTVNDLSLQTVSKVQGKDSVKSKGDAIEQQQHQYKHDIGPPFSYSQAVNDSTSNGEEKLQPNNLIEPELVADNVRDATLNSSNVKIEQQKKKKKKKHHQLELVKVEDEAEQLFPCLAVKHDLQTDDNLQPDNTVELVLVDEIVRDEIVEATNEKAAYDSALHSENNLKSNDAVELGVVDEQTNLEGSLVDDDQEFERQAKREATHFAVQKQLDSLRSHPSSPFLPTWEPSGRLVQYQVNGISQSLSKIERLLEGNWMLLIEDKVSEEADELRTNLILEARQEYILANADLNILTDLISAKSLLSNEVMESYNNLVRRFNDIVRMF